MAMAPSLDFSIPILNCYNKSTQTKFYVLICYRQNTCVLLILKEQLLRVGKIACFFNFCLCKHFFQKYLHTEHILDLAYDLCHISH